MNHNISVILLGAGRSKRFISSQLKQNVLVNKISILDYSRLFFNKYFPKSNIFIVVNKKVIIDKLKTNENKIYGHLSALQGITYRRMGLSSYESMLIGAHTNSQSLISAAVRLNIVSSMTGQVYYSELIPKLADLCSRKFSEDDIGGFFPSGEIALLSIKPNSLFIN